MTVFSIHILCTLGPLILPGAILITPAYEWTVTVSSGQYGVAGFRADYDIDAREDLGPNTVFYWGTRQTKIRFRFSTLLALSSLIVACMAFLIALPLSAWWMRHAQRKHPPKSALPRTALVAALIISLFGIASLAVTSGLGDRELRAFLFGLPIGIGYWVAQLGVRSPVVLLPVSYLVAVIAYVLVPAAAMRLNRWSATITALGLLIATATLNFNGWERLCP